MLGLIGQHSIVMLIGHNYIENGPFGNRHIAPYLHGIEIFGNPRGIVKNTVSRAVLLANIPDAYEIIVQSGAIAHTSTAAATTTGVAEIEEIFKVVRMYTRV